MNRRRTLRSFAMAAAIAAVVGMSSNVAMADINLASGLTTGGSTYTGTFTPVAQTVQTAAAANALTPSTPGTLNPFSPVTVDNSQYPIGPWAANNTSSAWIGPNIHGQSPTTGTLGGFVFTTPNALNGNQPYSPTTSSPQGFFFYTTTFHLDAPGPYQLNLGLWTSDNQGVAIYLNNVSLGETNPGDFTQVSTPFTISSASFKVGLGALGDNTLTFAVFNEEFGPGGGHTSPTGLRVQGTISAVPEPSSLALVGMGLVCAGFGVIRNRRKAKLA